MLQSQTPLTPRLAALERAERDDLLIGVGPERLALASGTEGAFVPATGRAWRWAGIDAQLWHVADWEGKRVILALATAEPTPNGELSWQSLRNLLGQVSSTTFMLLARASGIAHLLRTARHCGVCGAANQPQDKGETVLVCPGCGYLSYPKISPCAIGVVRKGRSILLAHNVNFPGPFYSAIAGFLEAGESAEQCFVREVKEETAIDCALPPRIVATQAWPFPAQLMIGFIADYAAGEPQCDGVEIDHADWFDIDALPRVPGSDISIAGTLIERAVAIISAGED